MDINPIYQVHANYHDIDEAHPEQQNIVSDILVIDRTDRRVVHAPVYQLKQDTAAQLKEGYSDAIMHGHDKPFALLGQVSEIDKSRHMLTLDNGSKVFFNYLIIVTGPVGHSGDVGIFEAGLHALVEALKLRRQGIAPGFKSGVSNTESPHASAKAFISDDIRDLIEHMMVTRRATRSISLASPDSQTVFEIYM